MRRVSYSLTACAMAGLTIGSISGCGQNVTADTTLAELLNQITVGDVVEAFQRFAAAVGERRGGFGFFQAHLSDDQRSQIEALQAQFDAGEITREEFIEQVKSIIGDALPNEPFVGFGFGGGPFGGHFGLRVGGYLDLTQEQVDAANEIFEKVHSDIADLRTQARDDILAVLTDEQRARLDEIVVGLFVGLPIGNGDNSTARRNGHGGFGFGFGRHGHAFDRFADALGLTDEQQMQIRDIRENLMDAIRARHEQARDEFLALLTPEQLAKLPGRHGSDDDDDDDGDDD